MSVRIPRKSLTELQVNTIRSHLVLQPLENGPPKFGKMRFMMQKDSTPPVLFFKIEGEDVLIPYMYSRVLLQKNLNLNRIYPTTSYRFTGKLLEHQNAICAESWQLLHKNMTVILGVYPGCGKTVMAGYLASGLNGLVLVLYHRKPLEGQWFNTFVEFTDAKVWIVGTPPPPEGANVILCMDTQFKNLPQSYRDLIKILIIDEAHAFCTPGHVDCLLGFSPQYILALTATLERDDGMESMVHSMCGTEGVFRDSSKPFVVCKFLTHVAPEKTLNKQGTTDWAALVNTLAQDDVRNSHILRLVRDNPHHKILILTWRVEHAQTLHCWITQMGRSAAIMAGNTKTYSDSSVLIGTASKIGTNFDEKMACPDFGGVRLDLLMLVGSTKQRGLLTQLAGRVFRAEYPIIIDFVDDSSIIKSHWSVRQKWYRSRNGTILTMSEPVLPRMVDELCGKSGSPAPLTLKIMGTDTTSDNDYEKPVATSMDFLAAQMRGLNMNVVSGGGNISERRILETYGVGGSIGRMLEEEDQK